VGLPANLDRLNANVGLHWMLYEKSYRKNAKARRVEKNEKCTEKKKKQEVKNQPPQVSSSRLSRMLFLGKYFVHYPIRCIKFLFLVSFIYQVLIDAQYHPYLPTFANSDECLSPQRAKAHI
jgi:hypothetical protein